MILLKKTLVTRKNFCKNVSLAVMFHPNAVSLFCQKKNCNMSKDTKNNLVGQPIFKQVMKILPREQFDFLVNQCSSDHYYKSFFRGTNRS